MAKDNNKGEKKVSGALVSAVVVIIAIAAFVPTVYMPYKNKKPEMDAQHQEALSTIEFYEDSIKNQAAIEAEISQLSAEWEKYQTKMFVDPSTALKDLNGGIDKLEITLSDYKQDSPKEDPSGTVTAEGNPLYFQSIEIKGSATRDQLLDLLRYIEEDSIGAYYVKKLEANPPKRGVKDTDIPEDMLEFKVTVYLYYFNQNVVKLPETTDTDTESAS